MNQEQQAQAQATFAEEDEPITDADQATHPGATSQFVAALAARLGEAAENLKVQRDTRAALERMKEGVIVKLHIARPRFVQKLNLEILGLRAGNLAAISPEAEEKLVAYFHLGRNSLLPKAYQDRLAAASANARYTLKKYAIPSHWGAFVPTNVYQQWKEEHGRHEAAFKETVQDLLQNYDTICDEVLKDYRVLAEDAWARLTASGSRASRPAQSGAEAPLADLAERLHAGEGQEAFIKHYLEVIRLALPTRESLEGAFIWEKELFAIPLPSVLAQDLSEAEQAISERAIKDATIRAELERIEGERRLEAERICLEREKLDLERQAELRRLSEEQRLAQQLIWQRQREEEDSLRRKRQAEEDRLLAQRRMEADILNAARDSKQRLVEQFHRDVVAHLNSLMSEVTTNVLESLEQHGKLKGPISQQLRQFIKRLELLNFIEDEQIEAALSRLRDALPTAQQSDEAARGLVKLDVRPLERVVRQVKREADDILLELGVSAPTRIERARATSEELEGLPDLDSHIRQPRSGLAVRPLRGKRGTSRQPRPE
jgi:hypothetical protein